VSNTKYSDFQKTAFSPTAAIRLADKGIVTPLLASSAPAIGQGVWGGDALQTTKGLIDQGGAATSAVAATQNVAGAALRYAPGLVNAAASRVPAAVSGVAKGLGTVASKAALPATIASAALDVGKFARNPTKSMDEATGNLTGYGNGLGNDVKALGGNALSGLDNMSGTIAGTVRGLGQLGSASREASQSANSTQQTTDRLAGKGLGMGSSALSPSMPKLPGGSGSMPGAMSLSSAGAKSPSIKVSAEFAPGIPDRSIYGEPLKNMPVGSLQDFVLQHHQTKRNPRVPHYDFRLGNPELGMHSWAVPKAELPGPGESRPVFQTQLHEHSYNDFQGNIGHGYGAGRVSQADKGKALITKVGPNTIHFSLAHSKVNTRYVLIHIKGRDGKTWMLMAKPEPGKIEGVGDKPIYKQIHADDQESAMQQAVQLQEKIDGAHGIVNVGEKGDVDIYSVRPSVSGKPIRHTERMGLHGVRVPTKFKGMSARGEMYYTDPEGRALPFKDVSGILNSGLQRSIETQRAGGLKPRIALFDTADNGPYMVRKDRLRNLMDAIGSTEVFHEPRTETTPEGKRQLFEDIREGRNPRTTEGVMALMADDTIRKIKVKADMTGYLAGTYPGKGKRQGTAGGLTFSNEPGGVATCRVGTGFSNEELADIVKNMKDYQGRPIRIEGMGQFESGKMRAPSFKGFETDKPATKQAALRELSEAIIKTLSKIKLRHVMNPANGYGDATSVLAGREFNMRGKIKQLRRGFGPQDHGRANDKIAMVKDAIIRYRGPGYSVHPSKRAAAPVGPELLRMLRQLHSKAVPEANRIMTEMHAANPVWDVANPLNVFLINPAQAAAEAARLAKKHTGLADTILRLMRPNLKDPHFGDLGPALYKEGQAPVRLSFTDQDGHVKAACTVEIADTPALRRRGLQHRRFLPNDHGMFFDKAGSYWMKDVHFPLDIVFTDQQGKILDKQAMLVNPRGDIIYTAAVPSAHAVELPAGWCNRHAIEVGDQIQVAS